MLIIKIDSYLKIPGLESSSLGSVFASYSHQEKGVKFLVLKELPGLIRKFLGQT
jgi:hypothetical protein